MRDEMGEGPSGKHGIIRRTFKSGSGTNRKEEMHKEARPPSAVQR